MADKKISALTDASTPLAGTEVLPIVQSGSTVKVSAADITAGRDVTAKSLVLTQTTSGVSGWQIAGNFRAASYPMFRMSATGSNKVGSVGNDNDGSFTFLVNGTATAIGTQSFTLSAAGNVTANVGNVVIGTAGKGIDFSANTHAAGMTSELLTWYEEGTWTPVVVPGAGAITTQTCSGLYTRIGRLVQVQFSIVINDVGTASSVSSISGLPFTSSNTNAQGSSATFEEGVTGNTWTFRINKAATTFYITRYNNNTTIANSYTWSGSVTYTV